MADEEKYLTNAELSGEETALVAQYAKTVDLTDTSTILTYGAEAQKKIEEFYKDEERWAKAAILNVACSGKFTSDRTIQEYVDDIWHLDKVKLPKKKVSDK